MRDGDVVDDGISTQLCLDGKFKDVAAQIMFESKDKKVKRK